MAYNEALLEKYRDVARRGEPFRSPTCAYCRGVAVRHIDPARKPPTAWEFWDNIVGARRRVSSGEKEEEEEEGKEKEEKKEEEEEEEGRGADNSQPCRAPVFAVGPMVDQSELPFRMLCRRYGATLAYSPMLHARCFATSALYRERYFSTTPRAGRGSPDRTHMNGANNSNNKDNTNSETTDVRETDYPLFVQFCGNDPDTLLEAARYVEDDCEAVDINLGCPQGIARRGKYGAFLMEDWERVHNILHCLAVELKVPVTAKMRVFEDDMLTLKYAEMLRDTGIAVLCVHGRTRQNKREPADMDIIRRVREHLQGTIPVIANGNVFTFEDVKRNLATTSCEGFMCAEPLLWDPRLFSAPQHPVRCGRYFSASLETRLDAIRVAEEYLRLVARFPVHLGHVKAHLYKMLFHTHTAHPAARDWLTAFSCRDGEKREGSVREEEEEEKDGEGFEHFAPALATLRRYVRGLRALELSGTDAVAGEEACGVNPDLD